MTLPLGVAVFPDHGKTGEEILQAADVALFRAKNGGRNLVVVADAVTSVHRSGAVLPGDTADRPANGTFSFLP